MKYIFDWKEYAKTAREAVAEGCVLLRNENHALPICKGETISVFGRSQFNYYKSGTGSGGMVNTPYVVSILDALDEEEEINVNPVLRQVYEEWIETHPFDIGKGWANEPWCQEEMELSEEVVKAAASASDLALVILGRTAGEDKDNSAAEGSYLLTQEEKNMLAVVCKEFDRVAVILNVGNVIDMQFVEEYKPQAVMYVWQGGMEGGHGVADVLTGRVAPSGHLTDTIVKSIDDYPSTVHFGAEIFNEYWEDIYVGYRYFETAAKDKVVYPFGFGLSYTTFSQNVNAFRATDRTVEVDVTVTNTGDVSGKEVVQVYYAPAQGALSKPVRNLIRFEKTKELAPGEKQQLTLTFAIDEMASFDDSGVTGHAFSYILEKGEYGIYVGTNVRDAQKAGSVTLTEDRVVEQLTEACAPVQAFDRMVIKVNADGSVEEIAEPAPLRTIDLKKRIEEKRPESLAYMGDKGYRFKDVMEGKVSEMDYLAQLSDHDLICMTRGEGMCPAKVTPGIAGSFGGVTKTLESFGMPIAGCSDGPSGIRMDCGTKAFANPNGTLLACSFNLELVERLYQWEGMELLLNKIDMLLGPGMNIHRNPLNGRNFEYFSEDPYVTGKMAAAMLKGMAKYGVTGTIKHFATNNQEYNRHIIDSVVSQRALREIYLKGYEIAVKEGGAYSIMTAYNPLNGIWTAGNYDLTTTILREEWGYEGIVMSDWWAKMNDDAGDAPNIRKTQYMIRSQNDLFMVVQDAESNPLNDFAEKGLEEGTITRGELLRNAQNILKVLMRSPAGKRAIGEEPEFEVVNAPKVEEVEKNVMPAAEIGLEGYLDLTGLKTEAGSVNQFALRLPIKGIYTVTIKMKSDLSELSQSSMTIFANKIPLMTITINGTGGQWIEKEFELESFVSIDSYVDLAFAQSGIQIGEIHVVRTRDVVKRHLSIE